MISKKSLVSPHLQWFDVHTLRPHERNDMIYGDRADAEMIESVKENGVLEALLITEDGRVISGHRRWDAARVAGVKIVPGRIFQTSDELMILSALIETNRQRKKSNEMIAREAQVLMEIESKRAKQRQVTSTGGATPQLLQLVAEAAGGNARDVVGDQLGVSGETVRKGVAIANKLDELEGQGDIDSAEKIRDTLNNRGYGPAFRMVRKKATPKDTPTPKPEPKPEPTTSAPALVDMPSIALPLQLIRDSVPTAQHGDVPTLFIADANGAPLQTFANGDEIESAESTLAWLVDAVNSTLGPAAYDTLEDIEGLGDLIAYLHPFTEWKTITHGEHETIQQWVHTPTGGTFERKQWREVVRFLKETRK